MIEYVIADLIRNLKQERVSMKQKLKPRKQKKPRGLGFRRAVSGYLFILPFILGFFLFMFIPLIDSFRMSLSEVSFGFDGFILEPVGFANYVKAFTFDPEFNRMLTEELTKIGTRVPFIVVLSFFSALLLSQKFKFRGIARAVFFMPVILSSGVIIGIETNNSLMNDMRTVMEEYSNVGQITVVLEELLLGSMRRMQSIQFILNAVNGVYDIMMASGVQILIFLAGIQAVPESMFEAAKIEGATAWECFWKITLPLLSSLILVVVIYSIIDVVIRTDSNLYRKIRNAMFGMSMDYGFSAAMSWIYFLAVALVIVIVVGVLSKVVFYDE